MYNCTLCISLNGPALRRVKIEPLTCQCASIRNKNFFPHTRDDDANVFSCFPFCGRAWRLPWLTVVTYPPVWYVWALINVANVLEPAVRRQWQMHLVRHCLVHRLRREREGKRKSGIILISVCFRMRWQHLIESSVYVCLCFFIFHSDLWLNWIVAAPALLFSILHISFHWQSTCIVRYLQIVKVFLSHSIDEICARTRSFRFITPTYDWRGHATAASCTCTYVSVSCFSAIRNSFVDAELNGNQKKKWNGGPSAGHPESRSCLLFCDVHLAPRVRWKCK